MLPPFIIIQTVAYYFTVEIVNNGVLINWGYIVSNDATNTTYTFPCAYKLYYQIAGTQQGQNGQDVYKNGFTIIIKSYTNVIIRNNSNGTNYFLFIAIGI